MEIIKDIEKKLKIKIDENKKLVEPFEVDGESCEIDDVYKIKEYEEGCNIINVDSLKIVDFKDIYDGDVEIFSEGVPSNLKYVIIYESHEDFIKLQSLSIKDRSDKNLIKYLGDKVFNNNDYKEYLYMNTISYFKKDTEKLEFTIDPINYVENKNKILDLERNETTISSKMYEVSVLELIELFNKHSLNLFSDNIRLPLNNNTSFINEMKAELYYLIKADRNIAKADDERNIAKADDERNIAKADDERKIMEEFEQIIYDDLGIKTDNNQEFYSIFTLKHNGITLVHDGKEEITFNRLVINSFKNVSIINGAQSISALYIAVEYIKKTFEKLSWDSCESILKKDFLSLIYEILQKIKINCKIICYEKDSAKYIERITYGLNNQASVKEYYKYLNEQIEINKLLIESDLNFEIVKNGVKKSKNKIDIMDFIKYYLIVNDEPGKAKNFNSSKVDKTLKTIMIELKKNAGAEILAKVDKALILNSSMLSKSKIIEEYGEDQSDKIRFYPYARNYALSYSLIHYLEDSDRQDDITFYIDKIYDYWLQYNNKKDKDYVAEFKKDDFWTYIIEELAKEDTAENENEEIDNLDIKAFITYYNKQNMAGKARNSQILKKYYREELGKNNFNFRTISAENNVIKEHMPIGLFKECIEKSLEDNIEKFDKEKRQREFKEKFKEIENKKLYVFNFKEGKLEEIKKLDLKEIDYQSKDAIEELFKSIKENYDNQEEKFLQAKDDKVFHIRTHARDKNDVMKYSSGEPITKRSIWINKSEIQKIYDKANESSN